jgi:glycosyltransferase involved in cell wall biosynthesis
MITVSNFVRETILEHCSPMNRSSLIVIPNGVDTSVFKPGLIQNDKSRLNLVSIARISNEKNLNYIFNTCRLLKEAGIPFVFHHAGSSKKEELVVKIKEYINEHKLNDCVILHGFSIDAKAILDLGDIFLSASITEGHPVAVLEAMASEKICFCSDIAPHRELGPELIHLFDIVDEFSLFRLLKNYYLMPSFHDEDKRCKMASDIIVEKFSIDRMVDSYVKLYD